MKDLSTAHISIKQSILSGLVNSGDSQQYTNVKISLLNNALVFPVTLQFSVEDFAQALCGYISNDLKISTSINTIGEDIYSLPFSPIGLGLMKKTVVFCAIDSHLYLNIVPLKEIENANYSEGKISELLSSGKTDQIMEFVERYILQLYPGDIAQRVQPSGKFFFTDSIGVPLILASHLSDDEHILAKLDIYKIEQSKSNALTSDADEAFYLLTTQGAYLFVLDNNLQEKYIETLSDSPMQIKTKIGRDQVICGNTIFTCQRETNTLFAAVAPLHDATLSRKLSGISSLLFNSPENQTDKSRAAYLLRVWANIDGSPFSRFAASFIEFCNALSVSAEGACVESSFSVALLDSANQMFSEEGFGQKIGDFVSLYNFGSSELVALVFAVSRVRNRLSDTAPFVNVLKMLKDKYIKSDDSVVNRAFLMLQMAKKLNMIGEKDSAYQFASDAFDVVGYNPANILAPGMDLTVDSIYSGDVVSYLALAEMLKAASTDNDKLAASREMAEMKPLIEANLNNILKYSQQDMLTAKANCAMSVFDVDRFCNYGNRQDLEIAGKFSKMEYMPKFTEWRQTYSGFKTWVQKAKPDKSFSSVKNHGTLVDGNNYRLLYELCLQMEKFFDLDGVEVYVFNNRGQGIMGNDDDETKYIFIDAELLDINNPNYMNASELSFALAREYAAIKLGYCRLTCHQQWRNFGVQGLPSIDVISGFAAEPDFLVNELVNYTKINRFARLLLENDGYFNFDMEDVEAVSGMLLSTLNAFVYPGESQINDLKEREFAALSALTAQILDRIGLQVCGNVVSAIKAMVHTDITIMGGADFCKSNPVSMLACALGNNDKPLNYDFGIRLNSLLGYYLSEDYKKI